jgi:hypothetical protein
MEGLKITCSNCRRRWILPVAESFYVQSDVESRPCPFCEGTLKCSELRAEASLPLEARSISSIAWRRCGRRDGGDDGRG